MSLTGTTVWLQLRQPRPLGVPLKVIKKAIASFAGVKGRMEVVATKPFRVIIDFAHTPNAIEQALKTTRATSKYQLIHVFGSAALRDRTKRPLMGRGQRGMLMPSSSLKKIIGRKTSIQSSKKSPQESRPINSRVCIPNRDEAIGYAISQARPGDTVIITGKGHEKKPRAGNERNPME